MMAVGALVIFFAHLGIRVVADFAFYPGRLQVSRVRGIQFTRMDLVVTIGTVDFKFFDMQIMWEQHISYR